MRCVVAKGICQTLLLKLAAARVRKEIKPLDLTIPGVKLQWQGRLIQGEYLLFNFYF